MTKFLAYYHLRPIHNTKDFLGISEDNLSANIIATIGRNVISITNIASQKEICSWTVLDKLSSKVLYDKASEKYIGVFGNTHIRCWDKDTADLNKIKKLKFKKKILDLVSSSEINEVLVLYTNGSCEALSNALEHRKLSNETETDLPLNIEISQSKLFAMPNTTTKMLTYFLKKGNGSHQKMELVTTLLDHQLNPMADPVIFKLARHDESINLAGYTIVENKFSPCLMTIWSDKRIFMLPLDGKSIPEDSPGDFISMLNVLNTTEPLSVVGLSRHCVVIYGANNGQEEGGSLILFNTQYKVVKAKQFFKIYFNFSKIWVVNNYILLAIGQNLSVITFNICQELLADMIGSQFSSSNLNNAVDELINEVNEEYLLEESIQFATSQIKVRKSVTQEQRNFEDEIDNELANGQTIPFQPMEMFDKEYQSLLSQNMHVEFFSSKENCDELFNLNLMSNNCGDTFTRDELEVIARHLKKYGASEQEISEKLITLAMKANLVEDIAICIRNYTNIYERILVNVLKFALKGVTIDEVQNNGLEAKKMATEHQNTYAEKNKEFQCPENDFPNVDLSLKKSKLISVTKPFDLVNIVLSCSFDTDSISTYIRSEIELEEALVLLQHLYNLIKLDDICLEERPETSANFDNDLKILEWFSIILGTHFMKLSFSRDLRLIELLLKWNDVLTQFKEYSRELEGIASSLYNIVQKKDVIHRNKYSKWYNVDTLKLF